VVVMREQTVKRPFYRGMLFQMVVAILAGALLGYLLPATGVAFNALAVGFIKLVRLVVGIIIFVTVMLGVAKLGGMNRVGKLALTSIVYFEVVTAIAFAWGMLVANVIQPGGGLHVDPASVDKNLISTFTIQAAQKHSFVEFLLGVVPANPVGPFLDNNILQVLIIALMFGFGITRLGPNKDALVASLVNVEKVIFAVVGFIMRLAPLAVFGAVAFVVGNYGFATLASLAKLVGSIYLACSVFIAVVFGLLARSCGISLWQLVKYLREELVLAFATASGEAVFPRLIAKMENVGCSTPVVGFVLPTGYSFNLDGGSIYLMITSLFIAQAFDVHLSFGEQLTMVGIFMLTSKGIAGVAGAGMVVLASSLLMMPEIPLVGLALALSVDRLSDPMRTVTNVLGNAIATLFIARWVGERDEVRVRDVLAGEAPARGVEAVAL